MSVRPDPPKAPRKRRAHRRRTRPVRRTRQFPNIGRYLPAARAAVHTIPVPEQKDGMTSRRIRGAVAFAAALAACDSGSALAQGTDQAKGTSQSEAAAMARARADSALHPYTDADVRFMSGMIGHHAQAIVMAGWAESHEAS